MADKGTLYVVATPIGNLEDITPRAAATLGTVDFIAAEDTRVTAKIVNHLGIKKPLISYHQHSSRERGIEIVDRLLAGESCALCCDAGTPAISDPGELLVRQSIEAGIDVVPIAGPCAAITALSASGMATGRFCFEGFIPVSKTSRRERLLEIKDETRTLVFYEAPHKLRNTLRDLLEVLGDREVVVARELTKLHEQIWKTTLSEARQEYRDKEPRGEFVLIVAGKPTEQPEERPSEEDALSRVDGLIAEGMTLSDACKTAAKEFGIKKNELYRLALERR